jgi:hypothetical protein
MLQPLFAVGAIFEKRTRVNGDAVASSPKPLMSSATVKHMPIGGDKPGSTMTKSRWKDGRWSEARWPGSIWEAPSIGCALRTKMEAAGGGAVRNDDAGIGKNGGVAEGQKCGIRGGGKHRGVLDRPLVRSCRITPLMHGHAGVVCVLSVCFAVVTSLGAQAERAKDIDAVFTNWNKPDSPGAAVAVIEHGKTVYEKGYGSANLEYSIPIGPETIFHVASVSKQFTAMSIVLLERDGKLSIDDEVHKYLPELSRYDSPITLRKLLCKLLIKR